MNGRVSKPIHSTGTKKACVLSPLLSDIYVSDIPAIIDDPCYPVTVNSLTINSDLVLSFGLYMTKLRIWFSTKEARDWKDLNFVSTILS